MSSGEGAGGLAGTEGPEAATPPEAIVEDPVANADAAAGLTKSNGLLHTFSDS